MAAHDRQLGVPHSMFSASVKFDASLCPSRWPAADASRSASGILLLRKSTYAQSWRKPSVCSHLRPSE